MQDLKVVGVDSGSLLLVADGGERYRITLDELAQAGIRSSRLEPQRENGRRVPPKEIQAHIRAGMSANEVASVTGADLSYVQRFEGPVVAEREYVIEAARALRLHSALETAPLGDTTTFGSVITRRISERGGTDERWRAWKQADAPWTLQVGYDISGSERTARWSFEVKSQLLAPLDNDAVLLSHEGENAPPMPRLRAVDADHPARRDTSRFDSGAFEPVEVELPRGPRRLDAGSADSEHARRRPGEPPDAADQAAQHTDLPETTALPRTTHLPESTDLPETTALPQTTDLLEALRRRRGERPPAAGYGQSDPAEPPESHAAESSGNTAAEGAMLPESSDESMAEDDRSDGAAELGLTSLDLPFESFSEPAPKTAPRQPKRTSSRRGRAAMPSWDEIVFGTKPDDPA